MGNAGCENDDTTNVYIRKKITNFDKVSSLDKQQGTNKTSKSRLKSPKLSKLTYINKNSYLTRWLFSSRTLHRKFRIHFVDSCAVFWCKNELIPSRYRLNKSENKTSECHETTKVATWQPQRKTCDKLTMNKKNGHCVNRDNSVAKALKFECAYSFMLHLLIACAFCLIFNSNQALNGPNKAINFVQAALIIGDSAIEIHEVDSQQQPVQQNINQNQPDIILGSTNGLSATQADSLLATEEARHQKEHEQRQHQQQQQQQQQQLEQSHLRNNLANLRSSRPLPAPILAGKPSDDITDGDKRSRSNHDYDINELKSDGQGSDSERATLGSLLSPGGSLDKSGSSDKSIAGKVVDFELTPAGGHNKAKIKKKKKKKKKEMSEAEYKKKWAKKKKSEKKAMEKEEKESMKKKKEEGKKKKKKWGHEEHGLKKKGKFKKKKWGQKVKKGKGIKKGKKGHKSLKDKGHKNTGFKTVYHKEEWGKSSKWHDIKREKKWDEKSKKWKKKWKKEKGKKYKGDHMKKFEKKKKEGKKYKKEKKEKVKKFKKEEFKKGKKKKLEEHGKKKEGGQKKEMKEMKKKKKKKG